MKFLFSLFVYLLICLFVFLLVLFTNYSVQNYLFESQLSEFSLNDSYIKKVDDMSASYGNSIQPFNFIKNRALDIDVYYTFSGFLSYITNYTQAIFYEGKIYLSPVVKVCDEQKLLDLSDILFEVKGDTTPLNEGTLTVVDKVSKEVLVGIDMAFPSLVYEITSQSGYFGLITINDTTEKSKYYNVFFE